MRTALPALAAFPQREKLLHNECVPFLNTLDSAILLCFILELDVTANFDQVFWLGDFNFRVTLDRSEVDGMLEKYKDQENPECKVIMQHSHAATYLGLVFYLRD